MQGALGLALAAAAAASSSSSSSAAAAAAAALPPWVLPPLALWAACALLLALLLLAATLCKAPRAIASLSALDVFTKKAAFWEVQAARGEWRRPLLSSAPLGGCCTWLAIASILCLALALLLRRSTDNTLATQGLSIFFASTWASVGASPWGASAALPLLLPSGLLVSVTAVGEPGACSAPMNWSATAPSHGRGAWRLLPPPPSPPDPSPPSSAAAAAAALAPTSFSLQCAACGLGWGDSLVLTLPYSCQGLILEAGAVRADGVVESVAQALPPPPPGSLLATVSWTLATMLHLVNDTRSGREGVTLGYILVDATPVAGYAKPAPTVGGGLAILPLAASVVLTVSFPLDKTIYTTTLSDRTTAVELLTSFLSLGSLVGLFVLLHSLALLLSNKYHAWVTGEKPQVLASGSSEEEEGQGMGKGGRRGGERRHRGQDSGEDTSVFSTLTPLTLHRRGGWAAAASAAHRGLERLEMGAQGEGEVRVNPLLAAAAASAAAAPAAGAGAAPPPAGELVPGWCRTVDPSTGRETFFEASTGRACSTPPLLVVPEGVDPFEYFECVEGERFYYSDGRRIRKGKRSARLMVPGWRRCVREDGVWFFNEREQSFARRPDYVY